MTPDDPELRALSTTYAGAADGRDVDRFLSVFAPDAVLVVERPDRERSVLRGHGELARVPPALSRYDRTEHRLGESTSTRTSDTTATGEVDCEAHHVAGAVDTVMTITYVDEYVLVDGAWRIARRVVRVLEIEDRTA